MVSSAPTSALRKLFQDRLSQLTAEAESLFAETREQAGRELAEKLNQAVRRMRQAADPEELAATLVDAASVFATTAAFFRVEGEIARGERVRGVPDESADRFAGMQIQLASAAALAGAVESRDPITAVPTANELSAELVDYFAHPAEGRVSIFPLVVRDKVRGLLYAAGAVQVAAAELLCQVAAAGWAAMEPVTVTATAPELVQLAAPEKRVPEWDNLPAEERQVHLKAQRFARVQAAEMRLHGAQAVQTGRARRDLYGALREPIDGARAKFRESFFVACPSMVDYLHLELVRTLANEDAELLGKDYPGPLV